MYNYLRQNYTRKLVLKQIARHNESRIKTYREQSTKLSGLMSPWIILQVWRCSTMLVNWMENSTAKWISWPFWKQITKFSCKCVFNCKSKFKKIPLTIRTNFVQKLYSNINLENRHYLQQIIKVLKKQKGILTLN